MRAKAQKLTVPDFKVSNKVTVIQTVWYWHKDKRIAQRERTESPEIGPHIDYQSSFKREKKTHNR